MDRPVDETDNSSPEKIQEELVAINDCKYTGNCILILLTDN